MHHIFIISYKYINDMTVNRRGYFSHKMRVVSQASEYITFHFYGFKFEFSATIFNSVGIKHSYFPLHLT